MGDSGSIYSKARRAFPWGSRSTIKTRTLKGKPRPRLNGVVDLPTPLLLDRATIVAEGSWPETSRECSLTRIIGARAVARIPGGTIISSYPDTAFGPVTPPHPGQIRRRWGRNHWGIAALLTTASTALEVQSGKTGIDFDINQPGGPSDQIIFRATVTGEPEARQGWPGPIGQAARSRGPKHRLGAASPPQQYD